MGWIDEISVMAADGELRDLYKSIEAKRGKVARILSVQSLDPPALRIHLDLYMHLMFSSGPLTRREREAIAVAVSAADGCAYCVAHHGEALGRYEKDPRVLQELCQAEGPVGEARLRAMADYARRLTSDPSIIDEGDVQDLRSAGLTDKEILRVNLVTAYFNFVNRIALGLGVVTDAEEVGGYRAT